MKWNASDPMGTDKLRSQPQCLSSWHFSISASFSVFLSIGFLAHWPVCLLKMATLAPEYTYSSSGSVPTTGWQQFIAVQVTEKESLAQITNRARSHKVYVVCQTVSWRHLCQV